MKVATKTLQDRINQRERILLYVENDIDSVFSAVIMLLILNYLDAEVEFILQEHVNCTEEYLKLEDQLSFLNCKLLILIGNNYCVDDIYNIKLNLNIEVILISNEEKQTFNNKFIHITPWDIDSFYPFKDLNLLVVVYKFIQAISSKYKIRVYKRYLDILVIKFLSCEKELTGENLELYNEGIVNIMKTKNAGILSMLKYMGIYDIDFQSIKAVSDNINKFYNLKFASNSEKINNVKILIEFLMTNSTDRAEQIVKYFCNLCLIKNKQEG